VSELFADVSANLITRLHSTLFGSVDFLEIGRSVKLKVSLFSVTGSKQVLFMIPIQILLMHFLVVAYLHCYLAVLQQILYLLTVLKYHIQNIESQVLLLAGRLQIFNHLE